MNRKSNLAFSSLGRILSYVVVFVVSVLLSGLVTKFLWNGIVTPIFGIKLITVGQAIALTTFTGFISSNAGNENKNKGIWEVFFYLLVKYFMYFLLGWIVMSFI